MKLFLSPHNDDAVLFGTFTLLREHPNITTVTCFDSYVQPSRGHSFADARHRRNEDLEAFSCLGVSPPTFLGIPDNLSDKAVEQQTLFDELSNLRLKINPEVVYAPLPEPLGNLQHNLVGEMAGVIFFSKVTYYTTYTHRGKTTTSYICVPTTSQWVMRKLRALACYSSQIEIENCREHFLRDQREYYGP